MPEVNKRTSAVLGSDVLFRSMYEWWATVFPKNYSCVLFLDLSLPRGTDCFSRKLEIYTFQREKYYSKLQTKA